MLVGCNKVVAVKGTHKGQLLPCCPTDEELLGHDRTSSVSIRLAETEKERCCCKQGVLGEREARAGLGGLDFVVSIGKQCAIANEQTKKDEHHDTL